VTGHPPRRLRRGPRNHPSRRKSHLAAGIYQYLPKDKWSVPENFTPILPRK